MAATPTNTQGKRKPSVISFIEAIGAKPRPCCDAALGLHFILHTDYKVLLSKKTKMQNKLTRITNI